MTKKEFQESISCHKYTGAGRENDTTAIFYDWKNGNIEGERFIGFKYCISAYTRNASRKQMIDWLFGIVSGKITSEDCPYYVIVDIAETDNKRFKVPICGSGLNHLT